MFLSWNLFAALILFSTRTFGSEFLLNYNSCQNAMLGLALGANSVELKLEIPDQKTAQTVFSKLMTLGLSVELVEVLRGKGATTVIVKLNEDRVKKIWFLEVLRDFSGAVNMMTIMSVDGMVVGTTMHAADD